MKENPANDIKTCMWNFLMDKGQDSNVSALKEYVYDLIKMTTQKISGQRRTAKHDISWDELDMTIMSIVIEATSLVLSGDLEELEQEKRRRKEERREQKTSEGSHAGKSEGAELKRPQAGAGNA